MAKSGRARSLADAASPPPMPTHARAQLVRELAQARTQEPGALLPILHALVDHFGWIDDDDLPVLADVLNLSQADVLGVVSFYHDFRRTPPPARQVRVCRGEACQSLGSEALFAAAAAAAAQSPEALETSEVFCLGNCALGPSALLDGVLTGALDPEGLAAWIAASPPAPGPAPVMPPQPSPASSVSPSASTAVEPLIVWVPRDAAARAAGADAVAAAVLAAGRTPDGAPIVLKRGGSRGMLWLEPLVEVERGGVRIGYPHASAQTVPDILTGTAETIGDVTAYPWLARQRRVSFARVGVIETTDYDAWEAAGGGAGLRRALTMDPAAVVAEVTESGLRGRGGAGFPTGIKWETVRTAAGDVKYVCCNADEGDSGTFADRMLLEGDPLTLIEGMVVAAYAVGARAGYIYVRSEYPDAIAVLREALDVARARGLLGRAIFGSDLEVDLDVRVGAGAYICGEETSMLESLEGKRGEVRAKPPIPALHGLFAAPTVVNNVLSFGAVPMILADGGAAYAALGTGRSRGTQVFQLAGNIARGGIVETDFGISVRDLVEDFGGGTRSGRPVKAAQIGGPLGAYVPASRFDLAMDYEELAGAGAMLGHGGIVVFDDTMDASAMARFAMEFCAQESCGKCTPCRVGSRRGVEVLDSLRGGPPEDRARGLVLLDQLCTTMEKGSLCAMGGLTPLPVRSALEHFPADFGLGDDGSPQ